MTSSWAYVWLFCIFFKELVFNVLGNPSFIFTTYKRSGLDRYTPSPKWVTPTSCLCQKERLMIPLCIHPCSKPLVEHVSYWQWVSQTFFFQHPPTTLQSGWRMLARLGTKHSGNLDIHADPAGRCWLHTECGPAETCSYVSVACGNWDRWQGQ